MNRPTRFALAAAVTSGLLTCTPAGAGIVNGGFETGSFAGWTVGGFTGSSPHDVSTASFLVKSAAGTPRAQDDAVVTSQSTSFDGGPASAPVGPTQGRYLAFLSNDDARDRHELVGTYLFQDFVVGTADRSISFDARYLTDELEFGGNADDDGGGVALLSASGSVLSEFLFTTTARSNSVGATATPAGGFAGGTAWLSHAFDLSGYAGQTLRLYAFATNTDDQYVESRLLLDNVAVNSIAPAAVPEPEVALLFALGAAGLAVVRRCGNRRASRRAPSGR